MKITSICCINTICEVQTMYCIVIDVVIIIWSCMYELNIFSRSPSNNFVQWMMSRKSYALTFRFIKVKQTRFKVNKFLLSATHSNPAKEFWGECIGVGGLVSCCLAYYYHIIWWCTWCMVSRKCKCCGIFVGLNSPSLSTRLCPLGDTHLLVPVLKFVEQTLTASLKFQWTYYCHEIEIFLTCAS